MTSEGTRLSPAERSRLEDERKFLLRSLEDLEREHQVGDVDEESYQGLKDDYVARAAAVLRSLQEDPQTTVGTQPESPPSSEQIQGSRQDSPSRPDDSEPQSALWGRTWRGRILFGVLAVAVVVGVIFGVRAINSKPDQGLNVAKLQVQAQDAAADGQGVTALRDYARILRIVPNDVVALTGEGELLTKAWVGTGQRSLFEAAQKALIAAEAANKQYAPAYAARGMAYYDDRNFQAAVPQFVNYLNLVPGGSRNPEIVKALKDSRNHLTP